MADLKTKENDQSVDAFLATVEDPRKRADCYTLIDLMQAAVGEGPRMWGDAIVGFGRYHYTYASGRTGEWPLVAFSPRKQNLSLYIMAGFGQYEDLLGRLGKHTTGKSCLYVKQLSDLNLDALRTLIEASVAHMRTAYS
ncbi:MAG TPA: DUF1801 domain-containing protein [Chloroflexi bacterium]|nr:DUF1801 domain-containing protein [Chloroflexota bacterium]